MLLETSACITFGINYFEQLYEREAVADHYMFLLCDERLQIYNLYPYLERFVDVEI